MKLFRYLGIVLLLLEAVSAPAQEKTEPEYTLSRPIPDTQKTKQLRMLKAESDKSAWNHFNYARELSADGNRKRAVSLLEEFLIIYPGHELEFSVIMELSPILVKENRKIYAAELYIRAFELRKESEDGWKSYLEAGRLLADSGETEKASVIYQEIINQEKYPELAESALNESKSMPFLDLKGPSTESGQ